VRFLCVTVPAAVARLLALRSARLLRCAAVLRLPRLRLVLAPHHLDEFPLPIAYRVLPLYLMPLLRSCHDYAIYTHTTYRGSARVGSVVARTTRVWTAGSRVPCYIPTGFITYPPYPIPCPLTARCGRSFVRTLRRVPALSLLT